MFTPAQLGHAIASVPLSIYAIMNCRYKNTTVIIIIIAHIRRCVHGFLVCKNLNVHTCTHIGCWVHFSELSFCVYDSMRSAQVIREHLSISNWLMMASVLFLGKRDKEKTLLG